MLVSLTTWSGPNIFLQVLERTTGGDSGQGEHIPKPHIYGAIHPGHTIHPSIHPYSLTATVFRLLPQGKEQHGFGIPELAHGSVEEHLPWVLQALGSALSSAKITDLLFVPVGCSQICEVGNKGGL